MANSLKVSKTTTEFLDFFKVSKMITKFLTCLEWVKWLTTFLLVESQWFYKSYNYLMSDINSDSMSDSKSDSDCNSSSINLVIFLSFSFCVSIFLNKLADKFFPFS